ncbi:translation initiation factor 3, RNA-binding subunit [Hyphopichia burtonii NRRL Y-1933]|uniref:Eukaryotic translation initiation factor 3 subunit G n=1 Tax=Hyphopichia burtonii NRRL Y-1933 TaxID=984485 RepID=A0A1E4RN12_9ASCO|nr:translation initiation factor 3, RNA-binding subunit [Hyphopichia burtonii NRRL Y-1933]ODV68664.1 translation initiation factor 3, RNA-binding subunit [Hyphopichia burtonii NRRL Y-1933]
MSAPVLKSWADAEDDIPQPEVTSNPDGTKTVISYRLNAKGQKVKITQKIKEVKVQEKVHPSIAIRRKWAKFGKEKDTPPGPDTRTTQLGEKVELKLGAAWKELEKKEEEEKLQARQNLVSSQRIRCRRCKGDHYTSKCPFKDTLSEQATPAAAESSESATGGKYVPPSLRNGAAKDLTRDDSTTLKVSQLNSIVDEDMIRDELFARFGPLQRVALVRNRETGESKGFAYVTFATESLAQQALDSLNGKGYNSLILHIEWSKKRK